MECAYLKLKFEKFDLRNLEKLSNIYMLSFNEAPYKSNLSLESAKSDISKKYESSLQDNCLVLKNEDEVIGFLLVSERENTIILGPMAIKREFREKSLGLVLMTEAISNLEKQGFLKFMLRVNSKAKPLSEYYSRIGFRFWKECGGYIYLIYDSNSLRNYGSIRWRKEAFGGIIRYNNHYISVDEEIRYLLMMKSTGIDMDLIGLDNKAKEMESLLLNRNLKKRNVDLRYPFKMRLEVTNKCNNRCLWCYASCRYANTDLKTPDFLKIISNLAKKGCFEITFSGGEPTVNPDLPKLISHASSLGMTCRMITNGTLLSYNLVKKLKAAGLMSAQVSLEGLRDQHNEITQNNCYDNCVIGIRNLIKNGINVSTNTTICSKNKDNILDVLSFVKSLGLKKASVNYCVTDDNSLKLSDDELFSLIKKISNFNKKQDKFKVTWLQPIELCFFKMTDYFDKTSKCSACYSSIVISANGDIRPCSFSEVSVGNIKKDNLSDIWNSQFFVDFRKQLLAKEKCKNCDLLQKCKGGCKLEVIKQHFTNPF